MLISGLKHDLNEFKCFKHYDFIKIGMLYHLHSFITHSDYMMFLLQLWKSIDLTPVCCILMRHTNLQYWKMFTKFPKQLNIAVRWQQPAIFHCGLESVDFQLFINPISYFIFLFNAEHLLWGCKYVHSYKIWHLAVSHRHKRSLVFVENTQSAGKRVCILKGFICNHKTLTLRTLIFNYAQIDKTVGIITLP